jgi:hypothetical protein
MLIQVIKEKKLRLRQIGNVKKLKLKDQLIVLVHHLIVT